MGALSVEPFSWCSSGFSDPSAGGPGIRGVGVLPTPFSLDFTTVSDVSSPRRVVSSAGVGSLPMVSLPGGSYTSVKFLPFAAARWLQHL